MKKHPSSPLHGLDLVLCDYLCGTIGGQMLRQRREDRQFAATLSSSLDLPELFEHIDSDRQLPLLLNLAEMDELYEAVRCIPQQIAGDWVGWPYAHDQHVPCLKELRKQASAATAESFATKSEDFARQLERDAVPLAKGVQVMVEWIREVRRLKRALQMKHFLPRPEGTFPTPTTRAASDDLEQFPDADIAEQDPRQNEGEKTTQKEAFWLSTDQIRKRVRCRWEEVRTAMDVGELPYEQRGRSRYVRRTDVEGWEERRLSSGRAGRPTGIHPDLTDLA
ncbi:MAG: hypothetical protein ACOC9P_00885 [bacterium]